MYEQTTQLQAEATSLKCPECGVELIVPKDVDMHAQIHYQDAVHAYIISNLAPEDCYHALKALQHSIMRMSDANRERLQL